MAAQTIESLRQVRIGQSPTLPKIAVIPRNIDKNGRVVGAKSPLEFGAVGDSVTDDTDSLNACFSGGGVIVIPPQTYKVTGTIFIPSNTVIFAYGATIKLGDGYRLSEHVFREGVYSAYPIVVNKKNASNISVYGLKVEGNKYELLSSRMLGFAYIDAVDCYAYDVTSNWINMKEDISQRNWGFNIVTTRVKGVELINCRGSFGGYEVFGIYDRSENVTVIGGHSGVGWRTSFQIHRGSKNINVIGLNIEQNHPEAHSCYTIHGSEDMNVTGVKNIGVTINGVTDPSLTGVGGLQLVEGNEHDISFMNGSIKTNNRGIHLPGNNNVKIIGNTIDAEREAVMSRGVDVKQLIKDNTLLNSEIINVESDKVIVKDNI